MPAKNSKEKNNRRVAGDSCVWEKRSLDYGATLKSVLFQGMPDAANSHFHNTHLNFILECLKNQKATMRILDIGCGYGRLSLPLGKKFPRAQISGMDISPNYVKLYRDITHRDAFIGTVDAIPPETGTFDFILVVTVLMYLPENKLINTLSGLLTHLNPGGKIILIEPDESGIIFQTGCGLTQLFRTNSRINTGGKCFHAGKIKAVVDQAGGGVIREERIPATTFFFLLIYLVSKILPQNWTNGFFRGLTLLDSLLKNKKLPTLWSFYLIEKK
ncbi:MAG TPA: methyltransferase domain-containing protein [Smithellaceae bacterium]|nr:methyltransferase domain-containing protein [Smithellaceae bacterium]